MEAERSRPEAAAMAGCAQRGSSLILMPAAVLVFVILGAFAVDFGAIQLGQREMVADAQAAANDGAAAGYDTGTFYRDGDVVFDLGAARRAAALSVAANGDEYRLRSVQVDDGALVVVVEGSVPTIFSRALPGGPDRIAIRARSSAELVP